MTSADIASLELEGVADLIPSLLSDETTFDGVIQDNGRATRVGTKAYRIVLKFARPGAYSRGDLDTGTLPLGATSKWDQGSITPQVIFLPVGWTKLVDLVGKKLDKVAIANVVEDTLADAADQLKIVRDSLLNTDGKGTLATVTSVAALIITLNASPFGARNLNIGQKVGVFNANALRGSMTILAVNNFLGGTQSIAVDVVPGGTTAGDFIRVDGVVDGAPVFINGLPVFHSTSQTGTLLGINKTNAYVVANGYDASGQQISLPILRLIINQVINRLGSQAIKGQFFQTMASQMAAYEELGFERQTVPLTDGKAKGLDLLFSGMPEVAGLPCKISLHADNQAWDLIQPKAWGKVTYGDGPFWYEATSGKIYPIYSTVTGAPTVQFGACMVDAKQYYVDNVLAGGRISNCKVPAGN